MVEAQEQQRCFRQWTPRRGEFLRRWLLSMLVLSACCLGGLFSQQALAQNSGAAGATVKNKNVNCKVKWNLKLNFDFKNAKLLTVVKTISKYTCQNFIIGRRLPNARMNIISETKVTLSDAYKAFFAALKANNMTAVRSGKFWKIVRMYTARRGPIRTYTRGRFRHSNRDELVTYLYRVQFLNISRLSNLMRQLSTRGAQILPYTPSNTLVITEYASNIYRLLRIVRSLDVQQAQNRDQIYVLQIRHAQASNILGKLRQLFQVGRRRTTRRRRIRRVRRRRRRKVRRARTTRSAGSDDVTEFQLTKLVADDRTNQIIVLCSPRALKRVSKLIKDLDIALPNDGQIWVHYLKFASADELAQTLSQLTQGSKNRRRTRRRRRRRRRSVSKKAADQFEGEVKVTADKATNSLVVVASRRDYQALLRVIRKLDIARKQVFVEIVILEVSVEKSRELGLTFHQLQNVSGSGSNSTVGLLGTRLAGLNSLVLDPSSLMGLAFGLSGQTFKEASRLFGSQVAAAIPSFGVMLRALQTSTDVDIVSTPHILTTANQQAELKVGQNVPFIAGTTITGGAVPGVPQVQNIQRQDVALSIKLKPQVDAGNYIRLDFEQELTELAGQDPELGPTTTKRKIKTVVLARDQQTVVIGGLVRDKVTFSTSKVPLLGDIPVLGTLFRVRKKAVEKRNLLVFLTPYIINTMNDFKKIFRRKMKERQEFIKLFYRSKERTKQLERYTKNAGLLEQVRSSLARGRKEAKTMQKKKLKSSKEILKERKKQLSQKKKATNSAKKATSSKSRSKATRVSKTNMPKAVNSGKVKR